MKTKNFESISISFVFVFLFWMGIRFSFHLDSVVSLISAILLLTAIVVIKRAAVKLSACLSGSQCGSVANSVGSFVSFNFPVCLVPLYGYLSILLLFRVIFAMTRIGSLPMRTMEF